MRKLRRMANTKAGFTIMETIIGFSILSLSLAGFSGMVVTSLKSFRDAQEKYIAAKIAQDGLELAINKKDNHVQCVAADPTCPITSWQQNLIGSFQVEAAKPNQLRPNSTFSAYSSANIVCLLEPSPNKGKFGYIGTGACGDLPAKYTREVTITSIDLNSVLAKSTVRWKGKTLTLETLLFSR